MTILMVTHDRSIAQHSQRIIYLGDGKIIREEVVKERKCALEELEKQSLQAGEGQL
jgi:ABC-type lipoprotein export system ATPase subunit